MEYASIERELHIEASPEVVFEVISSPEHIRNWWNADADFDASPGAVGELVWGDDTNARAEVAPITVVDADPPRLFSFRWVYSDVATPTNSLLVTFELAPSGTGTDVRFTETGFREKGWEAAVLEEQYHQHATGWDTFLPRIGECVARLVLPR